MKESQYAEAYLDTAADPATRWTPWTYLKYTVHGSAWSNYSYGYRDALMRALNRRMTEGTVTAVPSRGGSVAYVRTEIARQENSR